MNDPNSYPPAQSAPPPPTRVQFFIQIAPPSITRALLVINVLVFVAMVAYGYLVYGQINGTEYMPVLVDFGAKVNPLVASGEVWRLFTAMFIHIGVIHLLFNLYALNALGPMVEGYYGHLRFAAIYIVGGLFGSLASYAFSLVPSAGASGAIFGLAGATLVYFLRYRENFGARGRAILQNMLVVVAINLFLGSRLPGIDNWGHMGGLVGGALVAWGVTPRYTAPTSFGPGPSPLAEEPRHMVEWGWVLFCIAMLVFAVQWVTRNPFV